MGACRFMHKNLITSSDGLTLSSASPGVVGMAVPKSAGSALAQATGEHTAANDQIFQVEIDSVSAGVAVGQATFRWKRASAESWEAARVPTSSGLMALADGVSIRWLSGAAPDFALGDSWTIMASANRGPTKLLDGQRDTSWLATGSQDEHLTADLGQVSLVQAAILADHNLSSQATAVLMADDDQDWDAPAFSQAVPITWPHLVLFCNHSARHWRLALQDPGNADGAIQASMLHLCQSFAPARNFSASHGQTLSAGRVISYSDSGRFSGSAKYLGHGFTLPFKAIGHDDRAGLELIFSQVHDVSTGRINPLFFTPDDEAPAQTYYCLPGADMELRAVHLGRWSLTLSLDEVVRTNV